MQKQAVLVCSVCALAAILTIAITMTLLKRGKTPAAPGEQPSSEVLVPGEEDISDHYQISETSAALLPETADAGESYQKETLFLGDSNTVRLYANGLISLQQFCAKEGIGTHAALNEGIVTFKKDSSTYTIAQAVAKMKPRRVVIMLGTNDTGMSVDEFIKNYTALVQAIQESYPYTDIIVNTVPPVPANHANYPHMDQTKIDDFNMALLSMCEQMGLKFLNSAEALKDANGYGREDYYQTGDIHLKPVGLKDPKTGEEPYAVVQLRKDNADGTIYNLVGFQTHLRFPEQKRVFSMIPALHDARFLRYGVMHRNTYLDSPRLLDRYYRLKAMPRIAFAGQMTGVEGYVESCASGFLAGVETARRLLGQPPIDFPRETAIGALGLYVSNESVGQFQPMNINFGIMPPLDHRVKGKRNKNAQLSQRSLAIIEQLKQEVLSYEDHH